MRTSKEPGETHHKPQVEAREAQNFTHQNNRWTISKRKSRKPPTPGLFGPPPSGNSPKTTQIYFTTPPKKSTAPPVDGCQAHRPRRQTDQFPHLEAEGLQLHRLRSQILVLEDRLQRTPGTHLGRWLVAGAAWWLQRARRRGQWGGGRKTGKGLERLGLRMDRLLKFRWLVKSFGI